MPICLLASPGNSKALIKETPPALAFESWAGNASEYVHT